MEKFTSYFILGFILIFAISVVILVRNFFAFKFSFKLLNKHRLLTLLVIFGSILPAFLISNALIINDSLSNTINGYISGKIGKTSAIIYSRDKNAAWNIDKVNEIYSKVNTDFTNFLPIYQSDVKINNGENKAILISFDESIAEGYQNSFNDFDLNINKDEAILSESLAEQFNLKIGDKVGIDNKFNLSVKEILPDNGLIGFNSPISSRMDILSGSIYVTKEFISNYTKSDKNIYNSILLSRNIEYDSVALKRSIEDKINSYDRDLVFEELQNSLYDRITKSFNQINPGQTLLFLFIFPIIPGILISIALFRIFYERIRKVFYSLYLNGISNNGFFIIFLSHLLFITTLSSIIGVLLSVFSSKILLHYLNIFLNKYSQNIIFDQLNFDTNPNSISFAFTGAWIILFLTLLLWMISKIGEYKELTKRVRFNKLTQKSLISSVTLIILSLVIIYGAIKNINSELLKTSLILSGLVTITYTSAYLLMFKYDRDKLMSALALFTLIIGITIDKASILKNLWDSIPLLFILNSSLILISLTILFVYNINYIYNFLQYIFSPLKRIGLSNVLWFKPANRKSTNIFFLSILSVLIIILSCVNLFSNLLVKNINSVGDNTEAIILDELGYTDVKNILLSNYKDSIKLDDITELRIGYASLPDFKYKDIEFFDPDAPLNIKPEDEFQTTIGVVDENVFNAIKNNYDKDKADSFFNTTENTILCYGFGQKASDLNVRPNIKPGEKIKIKTGGNIIIERNVSLILEKTDRYLSTLCNNHNGILISYKDYENLNKKNKLYLSSVYSVRLPLSTDISFSKFKENFKENSISNIIFPQEELIRSYSIINNVVRLFEYSLTAGIILLLLFFALINLLSLKEYRRNLFQIINNGYNKFDLILSLILSNLIPILLSIVVSLITGIYLYNNTYTRLNINRELFSFPLNNIILISTVIMLSTSILFSISLNRLLKNKDEQI